jgi:atypical dual specificity phosphatase
MARARKRKALRLVEKEELSRKNIEYLETVIGGSEAEDDSACRRPPDVSEYYLPESFHWIIPGMLAGAETPTLEEVEVYARKGFNTIVCLQLWEAEDTPAYDREFIESKGMELKHIPLQNGVPPLEGHFQEFNKYINEHPGWRILVHCWGGQGRTGSMLAAYLGMREKLSGKDAIKKVREIWPNYIETVEQEQAVIEYLEKLNIETD